MGLLKACLLSEAAAGEGAAFDAPEKFETNEFVKFLKVHKARLLSEAISLDKTNIRRIFHF